MIVRDEGDALVLVTQSDHAALAAAFLEHWQADGLPAHPQRARILEATRQHDVGWDAEDTAPRVNPETGFPFDFMTMPDDLRQAVWPRALDLLADTPYEAALVAQHALTIYRRYDGQPAWHGFFRDMAARRDVLFQAWQDTAPDAAVPSFLQAYAWVSITDLLSLIVCHGWREAFDADHYRAVFRDDVLTVSPHPFDEAALPYRVAGRRLDRRRFNSDDDLRDAYATAPTVWVSGIVAGTEGVPSS